MSSETAKFRHIDRRKIGGIMTYPWQKAWWIVSWIGAVSTSVALPPILSKLSLKSFPSGLFLVSVTMKATRYLCVWQAQIKVLPNNETSHWRKCTSISAIAQGQFSGYGVQEQEKGPKPDGGGKENYHRPTKTRCSNRIRLLFMRIFMTGQE